MRGNHIELRLKLCCNILNFACRGQIFATVQFPFLRFFKKIYLFFIEIDIRYIHQNICRIFQIGDCVNLNI